MTDRDGVTRWYTADPRGIIPLEDGHFHVPQTLRQAVRQDRFQIRINHDFEQTMRACRENREGGKKAKGGVNLTTFAAVTKSVKAGEPDKSRLYKSLLGKGARQMPPKSSLADQEIDLVKAWIAAGAKDN